MLSYICECVNHFFDFHLFSTSIALIAHTFALSTGAKVMPATIQDVAERADVSTATVSRALRGLPSVAPSTRDLIISIAEELEYDIKPVVSRLASGRKVVGMVMPLADQWFYSKLMAVAELELMQQECDLVRYSVDNLQSQENLLQHLTARKLVDGLILCSLALTETTLDILHRSGVAVTTVETRTAGIPSVAIDNALAAELATRHLINLGHRRIGIITGMADAPLQFAIPEARMKGYLRALEAGGIRYDAELEQPGNYVYAGGAEAMKQLFSLREPPTAIFALSDEMAVGALKMARDMKLRVPEDISIMGFDDNDVSAYVELTTMHQPVARFSSTAVTQLMAQFDGQSPQEVADVELSAELVVRGTTGPPGALRR